MKKTIAILTLGILIGAVGSNLLTPKQNLTNPTINNFETAGLNLKDELNDYIRLKSQEEKFKKAEEILGKIMVLFLANVALRFEDNVVDYFENPKPAEVVNSLRVPKVLPSSKKSDLAIIKRETPTYKNSSYKSISLNPSDFPAEFEGKLNFLSKMILKKPYMHMIESKPINSPELYEAVSGSFKGELFIQTGKNKGQVHQVELGSSFYLEAGKLMGKYRLSLAKDGNQYSRQGGDGSNNYIKTSDKNKKEIILVASPGSFMQIYPAGNGQLFGSYYDDNQFIGLVRLIRE